MTSRYAIVFAWIMIWMTAPLDAQTGFQFGDSSNRVSALPVSAIGSGNWLNNINPVESYSSHSWQEKAAQSGSPAGGAAPSGGTGAAAATDPTQPLTQLQFQNVFNAETYFAHGYSNTFIVQPVIPIHLNSDFLPYHVVRPTIPIISPSPDIDGQPSIRGGLGDITVIDAFIHPIKKWKTNVGVGPVMVFPTASDDQLGLREWQVGPAVFVASTAKKHWVLGGLVQIPISLESDAYQVQFQPIVNRLLKDDWYVGAGDLIWKLQDQNGGYNIPLNLRIGKVIKAGNQPINIFIQPQYTPEGFHSGPDSIYGVKLSITFLLTGAHFGYDKNKPCGSRCGGCRHCR